MFQYILMPDSATNLITNHDCNTMFILYREYTIA